MKTILAALVVVPAVLHAADLTPEQVDHFNRKILPVLKERCYECHSHEAGKIKGGLTVDTRDGLLKGGDSGEAVVPGKLAESLLITSVRWEDPDFQMPPKKKLPVEEIALLEAWVKAGAPDPRATAPGVGNKTAIYEKAREHWAFKPVQSPKPPAVKDKAWVKTPVDAFILAKLEAKSLRPSPAADKLTLLRRVSNDLTGLPPTPEETRAFLDDKSPEAYARLVDRLLASPHYGERWARYWLDVARYADTTGSAGVGGRDNRFIYGWTYRDYVVRALNEDKPFSQFIVEQLAADRLAAAQQTDQRNVAALGFLTIGKRFTNPDDEIDDRIDATSRAFMGLTVSCARCHDHKFDPISTQDYYAMHGIFASTREPELGPELDPKVHTAEFADFEKQIAEAEVKVAEFEDNEWEKHFDEHFAKLGAYLFAIQEARKGMGGLSVNSFYLSRGLRQTIAQRWETYLKGPVSRTKPAAGKSAEPAPFDPVFGPWKEFAAVPDAEFAAKAAELAAKFGGSVAPECVSESATPLPAPIRVHPLVAKLFAGEPPKSLKEVADRYDRLFADIQRQHREKRAELLKAASQWQRVAVKLDDSDAESLHLLLHGPAAPAGRDKLTFRGELGVGVAGQQGKLLSKVNDIRLNHPGSPPRAMAVEDLEKPRNSRVFVRGDRNKPGEEVPRRFLSVLGGAKPFSDGSGRLELAQAIASAENPLTPRVIVNRVWMHHFGQGLVGTPSDFGLRGDAPTHPELLDFLARQLIDSNWSLKKLHRVIVTSAAYQQRSDDEPKAREIDPTNTLLWRMNRRRLDIEALRDALLAASGSLDLRLGGIPVQILGDVPRRTLYAFINRENVPGVLSTFDFALPEMSSPQRSESTVPTQALFLMNSPFVIDQARKLATLPELTGAPSDEARVRWLYERLFQRQPTKADLADALAFVRAQTDFKPEPPPKSEWKYGSGIPNQNKALTFVEARQFKNNEWLSYEKTALVKVSNTGGSTGPTVASVRRWVAPESGAVNINGMLAATTKTSSVGVQARLELRRGKEAPKEIFAWQAAKTGVATKLELVEVKAGDALDFVVLPDGKTPETYTWAPTVELANVIGDMPEKHNWDAHAEFSGPPPPPPKGMTSWEKYAQALLLTNEFVYVN